jgi:hypothetical protein
MLTKNLEKYTMTKFNKIAVLVTIASFQISFSQKDDDKIGSEVVTIVKPYSPTISDAFKVKEIPTFEDDVEVQKQKVAYSIGIFRRCTLLL